MSTLQTLFVTEVYRAAVAPDPAFLAELEATCFGIAEEDRAGRAWCREHGYRGYTSYASLDDLPMRASVFDELRRKLDKHVASFAQALELDLGGRRLKLDSLWINILKPGGAHSGHIHPHSVVSGTFYVNVPEGASALKLEDPRLAMMMAAPTRRADAALQRRPFVYLQPAAGDVILWESWLRHEVPANAAKQERISVSFNYGWR
ncbi:TIGR02466 family protein [Caulobacter sp. 17J80-11]|uniref:TIGR02466 family protein n=1 Tax=Caulobacter sp. 17J80-11 TaxID=2763502 RepID=UPI001653C752|nr:TIGR02466 family protein [Caulobacter sp. 17J80-11]MBC6980525.1 hypothetical protein [Caulobacter sp. 17J80-11]